MNGKANGAAHVSRLHANDKPVEWRRSDRSGLLAEDCLGVADSVEPGSVAVLAFFRDADRRTGCLVCRRFDGAGGAGG
jgi:hypothetical protein